MASRTSASRKRNRRKMMREAVMIRQQQQQQQQQQHFPATTNVELSSSSSSSSSASVAGTTGIMTEDDISSIAGTGLSDITTLYMTSREMLEKNQLHQHQQQQHDVFNPNHPPDCRCILRLLARDDLFLPPSMKNNRVDEANDKA
jgi:hypothetical protein